MLSSLSILSAQRWLLRWNVQSIAQSHGITRVADLARFLTVPRQSLYGAWRGTSVSMSVRRLELIATQLGLRRISRFVFRYASPDAAEVRALFVELVDELLQLVETA